jgi:excisionase family DNA binding protein
MSVDERTSPRFLTIEQVADELNVGAPLVRSLLKSGELRGLQVGGRSLWRVGVDNLESDILDAYRKTSERIDSGELAAMKADELPDGI